MFDFYVPRPTFDRTPVQILHVKCRESINCTGPGCKVRTGKTARKQNWRRPKFNQHEGSRLTARR